MAKEIERKFLVNLEKIEELGLGNDIVHGFVPTKDNTVVRARITGERAYLTLKGESSGISRSEFEYEIPVEDAQQIMAELCADSVIEKTRYEISHSGHTWELDIFRGENAGLVVAEIELSREDEQFDLPQWAAEEVTGQARYFNASLVSQPFSKWQ